MVSDMHKMEGSYYIDLQIHIGEEVNIEKANQYVVLVWD